MSLRETSGARELNVDADLVRLIVARGRAAHFHMPDADATDDNAASAALFEIATFTSLLADGLDAWEAWQRGHPG